MSIALRAPHIRFPSTCSRQPCHAIVNTSSGSGQADLGRPLHCRLIWPGSLQGYAQHFMHAMRCTQCIAHLRPVCTLLRFSVTSHEFFCSLQQCKVARIADVQHAADAQALEQVCKLGRGRQRRQAIERRQGGSRLGRDGHHHRAVGGPDTWPQTPRRTGALVGRSLPT